MNIVPIMTANHAANMALGISAGKHQACQDLKKYVEANDITIRDGYGNEITIDQLLDDAVPLPEGGHRPRATVVFAIAVAVLVAGIAAAFIVAGI